MKLLSKENETNQVWTMKAATVQAVVELKYGWIQRS